MLPMPVDKLAINAMRNASRQAASGETRSIADFRARASRRGVLLIQPLVSIPDSFRYLYVSVFLKSLRECSNSARTSEKQSSIFSASNKRLVLTRLTKQLN